MTWKIFYSYSHRDSDLREKLATYLAPLRHQKKIVEWYDRKIEPGADWQAVIEEKLESAHLILLLVSEYFLDSDYCFGIEAERALKRVKLGEAKVMPVLLKPCLWEESRFSQLQIIPRGARPVSSWPSPEEAFFEVAKEIRELVSDPPPAPSKSGKQPADDSGFNFSLELVRGQVRSYALLYEMTRQRMHASDERTRRMSQIFAKMKALATASYPLLDELAESPSPGERLAAIAILQVFANEASLSFLVHLIGSEKPFVGYQAACALQFAVGALEARCHPRLLTALSEAKIALQTTRPGFDTDRYIVLHEAEKELKATIASLAVPSAKGD